MECKASIFVKLFFCRKDLGDAELYCNTECVCEDGVHHSDDQGLSQEKVNTQ